MSAYRPPEGTGPQQQPNKGRITLSISDTVKDSAATYAEKNGISVSSMVETFLEGLTDEWVPRRRMAAADVAKLPGRVLTARGRAFWPGANRTGAVAYLEDGSLLIDELEARTSAAATSLRVALKQSARAVSAEILAPAAAIRALNEREGDDGDEQDAHDGETALAVAQRRFTQLLETAHLGGNTRLEVSVGSSGTTVRVGVSGRMSTLASYGATRGHELCCAAFNMSDSSDATYRLVEYQSSRISCTRTALPPGIESVSIQFAPLPGSGRLMSCNLAAVSAPVDLFGLGLPAACVSSLQSAAARKTGLVIVSGPPGTPLGEVVMSALKLKVDFRPEGTVAALDRSVVMTDDGIKHLFVGAAGTSEEAREKDRQALSATLRLSPDTVFAGEIRDGASATLLGQAAMAGVQAWCTIPANDAHSAMLRFTSLVREPLAPWIAGPLPVTVAWLHPLPRPCIKCSTGIEGCTPSQADVLRQQLAEASILPDGIRVRRRGGGCTECGGSGSAPGHSYAAEVFTPDAWSLDLIVSGQVLEMLERSAKTGFRPALAEAVELVASGDADPFDVIEAYGGLS